MTNEEINLVQTGLGCPVGLQHGAACGVFHTTKPNIFGAPKVNPARLLLTAIRDTSGADLGGPNR